MPSEDSRLASTFIQSDKAIFFYFFVHGSSDPNFCILEKNYNFIFDFFYFLQCTKLQDLKKKKNIKKNNKNCMILHCKNAEMTILLSFLHFYRVKSYNFCYFFFSERKYVSDLIKKIFLGILFLFFFPPPTLIV